MSREEQAERKVESDLMKSEKNWRFRGKSRVTLLQTRKFVEGLVVSLNSVTCTQTLLLSVGSMDCDWLMGLAGLGRELRVA